jgi:acyl dehydratase
MPTSKMHARPVPPTNGRKNLVRLRAELGAVVVTVRVVVSAVEPLIVTEAGMLHVAGSLAAAGVIAQLRLIAPVNPPDGVKVIVDVFSVVAPGATLTTVPVMEKLGVGRLIA